MDDGRAAAITAFGRRHPSHSALPPRPSIERELIDPPRCRLARPHPRLTGPQFGERGSPCVIRAAAARSSSIKGERVHGSYCKYSRKRARSRAKRVVAPYFNTAGAHSWVIYVGGGNRERDPSAGPNPRGRGARGAPQVRHLSLSGRVAARVIARAVQILNLVPRASCPLRSKPALN
jgi:hypothetical protein